MNTSTTGGSPAPGIGRADRVRGRARGAARANLAGALGQVWATHGAPGSILLTLFLKESLQAQKWQIGLVMTLTYLGPCFEPPGAFLAQYLGRRRPLFLVTHLINRLGFFLLALIPFLAQTEKDRALGIGLVFAIVGVTRIAGHLGAPAWWSWMADLVPERRRGRFFGCRAQAAGLVTGLSFAAGMTLLHYGGGMDNPVLLSVLFAIGATFGTIDIWLYRRVPEPPNRGARSRPEIREFTRSFQQPFRCSAFRRLLFGMGLWSFSANLVLPFVPLYQRGEVISGQTLGLGISWFHFALLQIAGSAAAVATSRWWARWGELRGPRSLLRIGSGYLFLNLAYLFLRPGAHTPLLLVVAFVGGALAAAWTQSANQLMLTVSPREHRGFYVSAYNFTNGCLMAAGPILGGLLADWLPVLPWRLSPSLPLCYFHLLVLAATIGGLLALAILLGMRFPARTSRSVRESTTGRFPFGFGWRVKRGQLATTRT